MVLYFYLIWEFVVFLLFWAIRFFCPCSITLSENVVLGVKSREGSAPIIVLHLPGFCSLYTKICYFSLLLQYDYINSEAGICNLFVNTKSLLFTTIC